MKIKSFSLLVSALLFFVIGTKAQNNRRTVDNSIGWYALFINHKLDDRFSLHGEIQYRRTDYINDPMQNLYRVGVNYLIHPQVTFRVGYAFADTYPYGEIPIQSSGRRFPEHRTYQMLTINNPIGALQLSHRFMLEQRFIGRFLDPKANRADDYLYMNRIRYMLRMQLPLKGKTLDNKEPYVAAYDELLIGFGRNVNQNVFDQNRLGALFGYRFTEKIRIEGGYLNQNLQLGRFVDGNNLFQNNTGVVINTYLNF
jgi:hypothetical protein